MIRRFIIKGFKRFEHEVGIDLDKLTVLVGANNSGKSTILQALNLYQYCVEVTRRRNGNGDNGLPASLVKKNVKPEEFGALPVSEPDDLWPNGKMLQKQPIVLAAQYDNGTEVRFEFGISYNLFSIQPSVSGPLPPEFETEGNRLVPIFSGFLPKEEFLTPPARLVRVRMQRHGDMMRNLLWELREKRENKKRWDRLVSILQQLFPETRIDVEFNIDEDPYIRTEYRDRVLRNDLDVIVAGSGFHQVLQLFTIVLAPGGRTVLLDEPDAHLHARVQNQLLGVLRALTDTEDLQFVIATHSPHLFSAAPAGSVRVCVEGKVLPLGSTPEQVRVLDEVGAIDRMEVIPLLSNRTVVFVENRGDRKLLESFARRLWGEKKQREIWNRLTFLFTYQHPVAGRVLDLARQVHDLVTAMDRGGGRQVRFLAIGDRDYRTDTMIRQMIREISKKAASPTYGLEFRLLIWEANEIENHLLDDTALLAAVEEQLKDRTQWKAVRADLVKALGDLMVEQREEVRQQIATRIQHHDKRLDLKTAVARADEFLSANWADGRCWCDAKKVIAGVRAWLQARKLPATLSEERLIEAMKEVPPDVERILKAIRRMSTGGKRVRSPADGRGSADRD